MTDTFGKTKSFQKKFMSNNLNNSLRFPVG